MDSIDPRIKTIKAKLANKPLLLRGLPAAGFTKNKLDWNLKYFCELAKVPFESIVSMNSHIIDTAFGILRLEFLTENQRTQFFTYVKQNRLDGGFQQKKCKVKDEPDSNAGDRLAKRPFYTLLEIFRNILPEEEKGPRGQLQSDINTLDAPSSSLLAQVSYILHRFPRRYVCVIFVTSRYLEDIQSNWQATFDSNMDKAKQLIQALSRAAIDRATTYRFSYDKAFGISNTKFPSSTSPYPILFMDMLQSLANLLSAHPQLPLQGALGLLKTTQQLFHHYQIDTGSFGKNSKSKGRGTASSKGTQSNKGKQSQGKPKGSYSDRSLIKLSMEEDMMTTLIQDPQDPHTEREKADPDLPLSTARTPTTTSRQINLRTNPTTMCTSCSCLPATNQQCFTCDQAPLPDTSNSEVSMPIFDHWCPGIPQDGNQCSQLLGQGQCPLCQFHLQFIKNEKNFHQQILPSSFEWTMILQFDLYPHQLEIAEEDSCVYYFTKSTKSLPMKYSQLDFDSFNFEDWPLYFVLFYHLDSRIDDWLPIPHPGKLPYKLPGFQEDQAEFTTSGYPINERLLADHLFVCQWYSENIGKFIRYNQKTIMDNWQISFKDNPDIHPARVASIPWDILVASSALIAVDAIEDKSFHQDSLLLPAGFSDGFLDAILSPLQPRLHLDYIGSPSDHWKTIKRIRSKYQPRTQSVNKPDGTPYLKSEKSQILAQHLR